MEKKFGILPSGEEAGLYTISCGGVTAGITDYGAALVSLLVPDSAGNLADVVLGFDDCAGYANGDGCLGATVGRSANRIQGAAFRLGSRDCCLTPNENGNNLHSGPDFYFKRRDLFSGRLRRPAQRVRRHLRPGHRVQPD